MIIGLLYGIIGFVQMIVVFVLLELVLLEFVSMKMLFFFVSDVLKIIFLVLGLKFYKLGEIVCLFCVSMRCD